MKTEEAEFDGMSWKTDDVEYQYKNLRWLDVVDCFDTAKRLLHVGTFYD